jgi:demethoxyubiquinone hydroxylase (CLK1/Coq7/Cat5 family)
MAAELSAESGGVAAIDTATVQTVLEQHLRRHLNELADVKPSFR